LADKIKKVAGAIAAPLRRFGDVFGFTESDDESEDPSRPKGPGGVPGFDGETSLASLAQVVSPQERAARSIEEKRETSTAEVTIKTPNGTAEVTKGKVGRGLRIQDSGEFAHGLAG
jgi:hypothetical protein